MRRNLHGDSIAALVTPCIAEPGRRRGPGVESSSSDERTEVGRVTGRCTGRGGAPTPCIAELGAWNLEGSGSDWRGGGAEGSCPCNDTNGECTERGEERRGGG